MELGTMLPEIDAKNGSEGAWKPGIGSELSYELLALASIFRSENIFNDVAQARELHEVTGIDMEQLAIFRPKRLALHEVLVRVTADYEIPDPQEASISSLGMTLRHMAQVLMSEAVETSAFDMEDAYAKMRKDISDVVREELNAHFPRDQDRRTSKPEPARHAWRGFFRKRDQTGGEKHRDPLFAQERRRLCEWQDRAQTCQVPAKAAALRSLARVSAAVQSQEGRVIGAHSFLGPLAVDLACNEHGAEVIGRLLEPRLYDVAQRAGLRKLPTEVRPMAMVTKGASASGKSTMRPLQRKLASKMGLQWSDFALISPDTWRRILLDFESLGPRYKYAGMLTSHEVNVIDRKLDAYLVRKGEEGRVSHLLVDRFRFDSFALDSEENRHLASRFGNLLCYFFMITPPEETVERAWKRGLELGRFKAVDDLLAHNVEAFTGMQNILFGRALDPKVHVHFEFLDNGVPRGEVPLTAAFGWSGEMNILDVKRMLDMERYRHIDVYARSRLALYDNQKVQGRPFNTGFLAKCIRQFRQLNLADRRTGRICARFEIGQLRWVDNDALACAVLEPEVRAALVQVAPQLFDAGTPRAPNSVFLRPERFHTIGRWLQDA
jgi:hypothetical protein